MENKRILTVNPVPAKTWYWLKMNDRKVKVSTDSIEITPSVFTSSDDLSGVYTDALSELIGGAGAEADALVSENVTSPLCFSSQENSLVRLFYQFKGHGLEVSRVGLTVPEGCSMVCVMDYQSAANPGEALVQTKVLIEKNAHLTLVQVHRIGDSFHLMTDIAGKVKENGRLDLITLVTAGKENDLGYRVELAGKNAHAELSTGYVAAADHVLDFNYYIPQSGKMTTCQIRADGVLRDHAKKVFRGTIDFLRGSAGARSAEREHVLLIDDTVVNQTLPVILCSEEDVEGAHGASIGKLDDSLLFYLQSRGLPIPVIYEMMAKARLSAVAALIPDDEFRKEMEDYLERN